MTTVTHQTRARRVADARPGFLTASARIVGYLASWWVWLPTATVYGVFAAVFFGTSAPFAVSRVAATCGQPAPDVRFFSSAQAVDGFLQACGPTGREAYRAMQVADLAYPLVFAVFLASSLALVLTRLAPGRPVVALAAVPFIASAFDYVENVFAWVALASYPSPAASTGLLGLASTAKTVTSWLAGVVLLGALGILLARTALGRFRPRGVAHDGKAKQR